VGEARWTGTHEVHGGRCTRCGCVADLFVLHYSVYMLCPACTLPHLAAAEAVAETNFPQFQFAREVRKEVESRSRGPSVWVYGDPAGEPQACCCGASTFPLSAYGRDYLERHSLIGRLRCPACG
jgi:hypothetical protein